MPTARDRERFLKSLLILVVGLPFAFLFWLQSERALVKPPPHETKPKIEDNKTKIGKHESVSNEGTPAESPPPDSAPKLPAKVTTPAAVEPPPPTIDQLLAQSQRKVIEARDAFLRIRDRADVPLLTKFGGNEWQGVQELQQQAELSPQPNLAIECWQEAKERLTALIPQLPLRQKTAELRDLELAGDDAAFLAALREASQRYPDQFDALWQQVSAWGDSRWFDLCQSEIKRMAPDDPGFTEIWLAVADYQETRRDLDAARTAADQAWVNVARMTHPVRAVESGLDCLRRLPAGSSSPALAEKYETIATLIGQIRDRFRRAEFLADLAALAFEQGDNSSADKYRQRAEAGLTNPIALAIRCRALATSATPDQLFDVAAGIPKRSDSVTSDDFALNTIAYSQVARAAVRANDRPALWRSQLTAEIQQLDVAEYMAANPVVRCLLTQADLAQRNWRRAIITANNVADPGLRASIIYPVMQAAPTEVPAELGLELFALRPTDRGAARAMAAYLPHHFPGERSSLEWHEWIAKLKHSSSRAVVYLALARHAAAPVEQTIPTPIMKPTPSLDDARSLVEAAEFSANGIQEPLSRAYAQMWIAICWHRLQKPDSYSRTCDQFDRELFQAWRNLWRSRPPARTTVSNAFYADQTSYLFDPNDRGQRELKRQQQNILDCSMLFAEAQAFVLNDSRRAIETTLDTARASHTLVESKPELRIRLRSIVESVRQDCELPTGLMDGGIDPVNNYLRMILATSKPNLANLKKLVQTIEANGPGFQYNRPNCIARGHAEIAFMAAKQGQLDDYRSERRTAISVIESQNATDSIGLLLMEADANGTADCRG